MFNKDWNTYKTNWKKGVSQNGFSGGVKSIFQSSNSSSTISKDQVQILRNWNNAVKHGCTDQATFNRIIANADENTKMYFAGLNKGKASMEGLKNAQNVAKTSTIGLTIAQTALNIAISMGLMAAISLAIKGFDKFVNSAKRASEAADEAFSETNDKVQEYDRELKSLDELIVKYKELKESENLDLEGRKEIKEIQNDIADLVGTQAKNLDLVNGKLDDEIKKLDEISAKEAKRAYETATANYNNSQKANKNATGDDSFLFFDGIAYTGKLDKETKKREKEAAKILQKSGFYNVQLGGFLENTLFVRDEFDNNNKELKGAQEKADYLQSMIDVLEQNGQRATDLYAGLIKQRDDYLKYIDNQQSAANSLVNSWLTYSQFSNEELSKINVDSVKSFETYRQKMIDEAKKDESIGKMLADGTLSNENLENTINDFMATSINFSTWYEKWIRNVHDSTSDDKIDVSSQLSGIQSLSKGFDQLSKIYSDVKDSENFNFSSILNNKEFTEAFGGLGESYENFIKTITNSPNDIKACQSAFNDLATAYINNSGALANVTEETKNSTIAMFKQMGVVNAEEVVTAALTKAKSKQSAEEAFLAEKKENSAISSSNLAEATWQEIYAVWAESTASESAKQYLAQLALTKLDVQGIKIDSKSDVDNIIALANAAGTSTEYLNALKKALSTMQNFKGTVNYGYALISDKSERAKHEAYVDAENTFKDILNSVKNTQLKASDFYAPITYGGGSTSNKGSSKDTKETFDWIETKISRLQRSITNFGKTVSATWKSWTDRNSALKSQISAVTSEINLQQQATNKYLSLANGVGLSGTYKELVRNGSLNISTITDENTIDAIKKYQEYYNAYLDCLDAKQDAQDELASLVREDFDMIAKQFDSEISLVEANINTLEAYIDQTEMKGNLVSKNYYSAMYTEEQKNLSSLQKKYDQLSNKLSNGTIAQGSEEFNNMATEIKEVSKAIIESNTALEEYQKTMRELDWEVFDLIEEKIGNVVEESEFLIDLLSNSKLFNDDGSITSQGQATLGLHVANMRIYESQVKDYAEEIARLDNEFANDSLDQNYLERRQELMELQRESILNCENEKNAIKDLYSDGMDNLLSYMDELISKRKELLSQASDARSFQKTVQEQTDEIARLQNIIKSYNGDLSEESKSAIQKYEIQLKEAESNLEQTLYDQYISDREKMFDALYD